MNRFARSPQLRECGRWLRLCLSNRDRHNISPRAGVTLIECLASIAVVGLLLSILVPAIQNVRSVAARMQCQSKLRQIGLAVHAYESQWSCLPSKTNGKSIFASIRHQLGVVDAFDEYSNVAGFYNSLAVSMASAMSCPADRDASRANYCSNYGLSAPASDGPFGFPVGQISQITDGLSQTALASEWLSGPGYPAYGASLDRAAPRRLVFNLMPYVSDPAQADAVEYQCQTIDVALAPVTSSTRGWSWMFNNMFESGYNHQYVPNANSCANSGTGLLAGLAPSSNHNSGVNIVMMDGSGRLIASQIDKRVWRALGSRAGGESTGLE